MFKKFFSGILVVYLVAVCMLQAQGETMSVDDFKKQNVVFDNFINLVKIPSPTLEEDKVANWIVDYLKKAGVKVRRDEYGNVLASIEATDKTKTPILFSSHMDVVGDNSPVNVRVSEDKKYFETDKKRTLGADDKAGIATAITLAAKIANDKSISHGGLELLFTRDEEKGLSGVKHFNSKDINSKYIFVLDSDALGEVLISGASYTNMYIKVKTFKGGHSGNDIHDKSRLNAVKLIAELTNEIPQGVYKKDNLGTVTSINLGLIIGGGVQDCIRNIAQKSISSDNYIDYIADNGMTNIINTEAEASYSIRSTEKDTEKKLISDINKIVDKFNKKYEGLAVAEMVVSEHLPPFEKSNDTNIETLGLKAGEMAKLSTRIGSFHAGAETHLFASMYNKSGEKLSPALIGVANILNMHSSNEMVEIESLLKGYEFIKAIFYVHNGITND